MDKPHRSWTVTSDKFLSNEQIEALLKYLKDSKELAMARGKPIQTIEDYYIIRILLETGLRVFEFCDLELRDLNGLRLAVRRGKGSKPRTVLLTGSTRYLIQEWFKVRKSLGYSEEITAPMFPNSKNHCLTTRAIQKRTRKVFKQAGLPDTLTTHSLRHSYASLLLASGKVSLATVRDNLGHSSIAITNIYSHACGSLENVELIPNQNSSDLMRKEELPPNDEFKNLNKILKAFMRSANKKRVPVVSSQNSLISNDSRTKIPTLVK